MEWLIRHFADFATSYVGSIFFILIGIWLIKQSLNSGPIVDKSVFQPNLSRLIGGMGFVILSILIFILKLLDKV